MPDPLQRQHQRHAGDNIVRKRSRFQFNFSIFQSHVCNRAKLVVSRAMANVFHHLMDPTPVGS